MDNKNSSGNGSGCCQGIYWWAMLVVAVLAVPAIGIVVAIFVSGTKGFLPFGVFMVTCWACTYLGMKLMHNSEKK